MKKYFLCFLIIFLACGINKKNPVIFISIDNLSPDYIEKLENLNNFKKDSVIFKNSFTQYPFCLPSHLSIFTSTSFLKNKCYLNEFYYLNKDIKTSSEVLKEKGYKNFGFVSGKPLKKISGIDRGFDIYNDLFFQGYNKNLILSSLQNQKLNIFLSYRPATETFNLALDSIKGEKKPFFLFIHLNDSYPPFSPPEEFIEKNKDDLYKASLSYIDFELGKFIEEIKKEKIYEKAFIVITSDHGTIKEEKESGMNLNIENLKVPLLIKFPEKFKLKNKEIDEPVSITSIFPTLFSFLKIKDKEFSKQNEGEDLKNLILNNKREKSFELPCLTLIPYHFYGLNPKYSIIDKEGKVKGEKDYFEIYKVYELNLDFHKEILRANEQINKNELKEAQNILSKYYDIYKNSFIYLKTLFQEKLLEKDFKGAEFCIEKLKENFGESPELDFEKYKLFLNFGERENALNLLYNSMEKYEPYQNFVMEAFSLEGVKNQEEYKNFMKKIPIGIDENLKYTLKGIENIFIKDEIKAKENFEKAILMGAEIPIPYFQVGLILKKEGKFDGSLPYLYSAFILNQSNPRFLYEVGDTFAVLGDFEKAYNFFKKAYQIQPSNLSILIGYLKTSYLTKKKEEVQFLKNEILNNYKNQINDLIKQDKILNDIISGSL